MKYLKRYNESIDWDDWEEEENSIPDDFIGHEDFYNFLVDNDVLDTYLYNFKNDKHQKDFKKFINQVRDTHLIDAAFTWSQTPEGNNYWYELNIKWKIQ